MFNRFFRKFHHSIRLAHLKSGLDWTEFGERVLFFLLNSTVVSYKNANLDSYWMGWKIEFVNEKKSQKTATQKEKEIAHLEMNTSIKEIDFYSCNSWSCFCAHDFSVIISRTEFWVMGTSLKVVIWTKRLTNSVLLLPFRLDLIFSIIWLQWQKEQQKQKLFDGKIVDRIVKMNN